MCNCPVVNWALRTSPKPKYTAASWAFYQMPGRPIHPCMEGFSMGSNDLQPIDAILQLIVQHEDIVNINNSKTLKIDLYNITNTTVPIEVEAIGAGNSDVYANVSNVSVKRDLAVYSTI
ncbi:hypothetical protein NQ317_010886 [Molorchus minor]|uniref:Uncharacterized protein n=1 Tax=Molorchus minor TaxID=1323400 RepID=A0ABQ9JCQ3_9CUCU|nr:hypothetical protein NQ317_010886 [Molorchus minor]